MFWMFFLLTASSSLVSFELSVPAQMIAREDLCLAGCKTLLTHLLFSNKIYRYISDVYRCCF